MKHWKIVAFGRVCNTGFVTGRAFASSAVRAVELSGEPSAIAFPSLEFDIVANAVENFEWVSGPSLAS